MTATSLFVVALSATSGALAYGYQRRVDFASGLAFALVALPGATIGAMVAGELPRRLFMTVFTVVLGGLALWLLRGPRTAAILAPASGRTVVVRSLRDRQGNRFIYRYQLWKALTFSAAVGFFSSLLGIGGGVVYVPVLAFALHFPVHVAAATSQLVLALVAAEGSIVHVARGELVLGDTLWRATLLAIGAIPGAQLARRVRSQAIVRLLAAGLLLTAVRLGMSAIQG